MPRTRVKICGITNAQDAANAVACGVDALGFNFYQGSARYIDPETAAAITSMLPAFVTTVGLFVDESPERVAEVLGAVSIDLLQFHGDETADYCEEIRRPYIKALRATSADEIKRQAANFSGARALLLDSDIDGQFGGTGETFDWRMVPRLSKPVIVAGGLNANNVFEAIRLIHPYGVDVSGGVEGSKGVKELKLVKAFMSAVESADREGI